MSLNTTPRTWVAGEIVTATEMNTEIRDALTGIQAAWASYTPALTAATTNPTLGTGSQQTGAYLQIGKTLLVQGRIGFGASGAAPGSGRYAISLPINVTGSFGVILGSGIFTDSSGPTTIAIFPRVATATTFFMYLDNQTSGTFGVGSAAPVVPAVNDTFDFFIVCQAA